MNIRMVNTLQTLINTIFMRMVISMNISIVSVSKLVSHTPTKLLEILNKSVSKLVSSLGLSLGSPIYSKPLETLDKLGS